MLKRILALLLVGFVGLALFSPVFAHGDEPEEEATTIPEEDAHVEEEEDTHAEDEGVDDHSEETDTNNEDDGTDGHTADEGADAHAEDGADDHGGGSNLNLIATMSGIIAAVALAGGAMMFLGERPNTLTLAGLALIGFTGLLHLVAGTAWSDTLLILNGIGYVVLAIAWVSPQQIMGNQRQIVAGILIVYTLITIIGYFATHDHYDYLGIISKVIEFVLLAVLALSFKSAGAEGETTG